MTNRDSTPIPKTLPLSEQQPPEPEQCCIVKLKWMTPLIIQPNEGIDDTETFFKVPIHIIPIQEQDGRSTLVVHAMPTLRFYQGKPLNVSERYRLFDHIDSQS